MMKPLLSLLALGTLLSFSGKENIPPLFKPRKESADTSKIGASAPEGGTWSFEENGGWSFNEPESVSYDEEEFYDGSKSLHVTRTNTDVNFTMTSENAFPVVGGKRYRVGFYYKSKDSYATNLSMNIETFDASGNSVRTVEGGSTKLNGDSTLSDWNEFFIEFQAKNDTTGVKMTIILKYGHADIYFDKAFCVLTGDDVFDETFSVPKEDGSFPGWSLTKSGASEDGLLIESGGLATTTWNRFLSGYGYTFTFDAKGEEGRDEYVSFELIDSVGASVQTITKKFTLSETLSQKSFDITISRGVKAIITFKNEGNEDLFIDNIHAVKSYSPNDEGGWQGQWITYPDGDVTADAAYQNRWYRKKFTIPEPIASASMQVTADDVRFPYVNGHSFGRGGVWSSPNVTDITDYLVQGENIFACRVYNGSYYSGLLFEITIITEGGRTLSIYSDRTTLTSKTADDLNNQYITNEKTDWTLLDYDDSSWVESYVVGAVGCMPWGSLPFISVASTVPEFEVVDAHFPKEVQLGDTMSFEIVWKPLQKIEKPISISASFWGKYSSDSDEADPAKSILRQVSGPEMTSWEANEQVTIGYEIDVPDFVAPGSYMLQFDEDAVSIVGNPDYSNNKLRGHYTKFLATDIQLEGASVKREKGLTKVQIGENEYAPYLFLQSDGLKYFKPVYAQNLYNAGMRLFSIGNNSVVDSITGESTWTDDGVYNFDSFDEKIYATLSGAPKAKLMVMVCVDPPSWWLNRYPEERALTAKGGTDSISYASKRWVKDASAYLRAALEHMKSMPYAAHIFAIKFAQGETYEWQEYGMNLGNCADFSKVAQDAWRVYLKERYKTEAALQAAWGDGSVTFANATIPAYGERESLTYVSLLDGIKQRSVLDYQDFKAHNITNAILNFSSVVKEVSDGKWLAGTYQGYLTNALTYESANVANNEFARLLEPTSPCDFFCGPVSYMTRQSGYSNTPMQAATSVVNAGKLLFLEFDERTVRVDMPDQSPSTMDEWGKSYTLEDTINILKRDAANTLISGYGAWIYDMTGGWYHDDEIYNVTSYLMAEWEYALKNQENENNREVAFVIEDKMPTDYAYTFGGSYSALEVNLSRQKEDLAAIGAGYDILLASDFKKGDVKDYRLYVVVGNRFDQETIDGLNRECKKDGAAVLWIGTPGIYGQDGSMSSSNVSSLIDMEVGFAPGLVSTAVTIDPINEDPIIQDALGYTYGKPEIAEVSPAAYVKDEGATVLGKIKNTDLPGLAYKQIDNDQGGYLSIFSTFGHVPASVLRGIMKKVGVHVYDESYNDVVFNSSGYLCIDSQYGGTRTITLPKKMDVYDVYNQKLIGQNIDSFEATFEAKETYLYRLMPANTYGKDIGPETPSNPSSPKESGTGTALGIALLTLGGAEIVAMAVVLPLAIRIKKKK